MPNELGSIDPKFWECLRALHQQMRGLTQAIADVLALEQPLDPLADPLERSGDAGFATYELEHDRAF